MEKINHDFWRRNTARFAVVLAALGGVSVANAAQYPIGQNMGNLNDLGRFYYTTNAVRINVPATSPAIWELVDDGVKMTSKGNLAVAAGRNAALTVGTRLTGAEIAAGAARFLGGPGALAVAIGMPIMMDYLNKNDLSVTKIANDYFLQAKIKNNDEIANYYTAYSYVEGNIDSPSTACAKTWQMIYPGVTDNNYLPNADNTSCIAIHDVGNNQRLFKQIKVVETTRQQNITPSQVPGFITQPPQANIVPEVLGKAPADADIFKPSTPSEVSGPASVDGPKTTTTDTTGKTTVTQEKTQITYNTNNVTTNTTNVTNNTVTNNDNSTTTTTTTTSVTNTEDTDFCKVNPESLACSKPELDTPDGEIPKAEKQITFTPENPFGEGGCPSDVYYTLHNGQNLKVWNWQMTCQYSLPIRALVIGLATFAAFLIVMPGETRV